MKIRLLAGIVVAAALTVSRRQTVDLFLAVCF
jgi:hypothetical protein